MNFLAVLTLNENRMVGVGKRMHRFNASRPVAQHWEALHRVNVNAKMVGSL